MNFTLTFLIPLKKTESLPMLYNIVFVCDFVFRFLFLPESCLMIVAIMS